MKTGFLIFLTALFFAACRNSTSDVIAKGEMPYLAKETSGAVHLVYGSGDSILYNYSSDKGKTFSSASVVAVLPGLAASHMRGPQIAATSNGLIITACDQK